MKKTLVALALAVVALAMSPAPVNVRSSDLLAALPAPPSEPVCIKILGKTICW